MKKVAIIIPTMNRSDFIIRLVRYYDGLDSPHPLYIGDSSDQHHKEQIERAVSDCKSQLKIHYFHWPSLNDREAHLKLMREVKEEYCVFCGDDDFCLPNSLTVCAGFLENNPEYACAHGKSVLIALDRSGAYGRIISSCHYGSKKPSATGGTAVERVLALSRCYWVSQFAVRRTCESLEDSQYYGDILNSGFTEYYHCYMFTARGKSKYMDQLHLVRQGHDRRFAHPDTLDWLCSETWFKSCQLFLKGLKEKLIEVDGVTETKADMIAKQCVAQILQNCPAEYKQQTKSLMVQKVRDSLKKILFLRRFVCIVRGKMGYLNHHYLLQKSSPYYQDFQPILNAINIDGNPSKCVYGVRSVSQQ
jgi:glycosyltransferase domain-containing protein